MNKEEKTAVVEELTKELSDADAVLAVDYRGISVPQAAELRDGLREAGTRFRVVKNRLTLLAADGAGADPLKDHLSGPTALALVQGDVALAAKTIDRLGGEWELLTYKGGIMDGEALDPESFKAIAKLPGRDALNAQFAGVVASPLTGLVRGLGSMVQGLASQLQQIADQGLVTGEAPAEGETPAEEAPAEEKQAPAEEAGEATEEEAPAEEPEAESAGDPEPEGSPEETTEEEPSPGDDVSEQADVPDETSEPVTEGDAEIGSAQEEGADENEPGGEETSEDSDENKEESD